MSQALEMTSNLTNEEWNNLIFEQIFNFYILNYYAISPMARASNSGIIGSIPSNIDYLQMLDQYLKDNIDFLQKK